MLLLVLTLATRATGPGCWPEADAGEGITPAVVATATLSGNCGPDECGAFDGLALTAPGQFLYFRIPQTSAAGVDHAWTAPVWMASPQN